MITAAAFAGILKHPGNQQMRQPEKVLKKAVIRALSEGKTIHNQK